MQFTKKDILGISSLSPAEIGLILDTAAGLKEISTRPIKKVPTLRGKTVIMFFYEPSTRTRTSFDIAAKRLSADTHSISVSTSSIVKGETLIDTARNLEAMKPDVIVIRHSASGAPHLMASLLKASIINAGDGSNNVIGGAGNDDVTTGLGRDYILGAHGVMDIYPIKTSDDHKQALLRIDALMTAIVVSSGKQVEYCFMSDALKDLGSASPGNRSVAEY